MSSSPPPQQQQRQQFESGGPYPPQYAGLGGVPTTIPDVPVSVVLMLFYIGSAILNMTILQINLRRHSHKFLLSGAAFGFSMARIVALTLRLALSQHQTNLRLSIAAGIFVNAGVLVLFIVNLILSQRIFRAYQPTLGWKKPVGLFFKFLYFGIFASLAMLICAIVWSFFTLDQGLQSRLRIVKLVGITFMAVLSFLPIPITLIAILLPRKEQVDKFGKRGSMKTAITIVLFTATLLFAGALFRASVSYTKRPPSNPGWFNSKAAFYCFNFVIEIICVYTFALSRFDQRFWIPNGAKGPGSYSAGNAEEGQQRSASVDGSEMTMVDRQGEAKPEKKAGE